MQVTTRSLLLKSVSTKALVETVFVPSVGHRRVRPPLSRDHHHSYAMSSFTSPMSSARELLDVRGLGARIAAFVSRVDGEEAGIRVFA